MNYLAKVGVCHRDLKPDNLRVSDEGIVTLIDFNISVEVSSAVANEISGRKGLK